MATSHDQLQAIGQISLLQIQPAILTGEANDNKYNPAKLLQVQRAWLSEGGIVGLNADDTQVMDIHHTEHRQSENVKGLNTISVGFTSHYKTMRDRFGPHLIDGIAGENIIIESGEVQTLNEIGQGLVILSLSTGEYGYLGKIIVAAPCVEFSHFANRSSAKLQAAELKATLQFLDGGRRGFYTTLTSDGKFPIQVGDQVFLHRKPTA